MNNEQVEIVKRTIIRLLPPRPEGNSEIIIQRYEKQKRDANQAFGDVFYPKLFELAPDTQELFKDLEGTKQKFPDMLTLLVRSMNRLHDTLNTMQELGVTHMKLGVKVEHYQPFVKALLWTFHKQLGDEVFNGHVAEAFVAVLSRICGIMCNSAYPQIRGLPVDAPMPTTEGSSTPPTT
ncbi:globin domain-containing protein [Beijerinckia indica]|uniref:Globin n=1 Tax=Beijerinckia indica subsp. indica (strain ATCC 9039 / DSM 1715 / NCIMB 8712) TaxID=395963 RepID=B2IB43_BEII9|nr:globin domain-containing protein [Beijerinckia indica]ACB93743.1 globin [Beijerinckia indica subsp. indica ATCC 9039]